MLQYVPVCSSFLNPIGIPHLFRHFNNTINNKTMNEELMKQFAAFMQFSQMMGTMSGAVAAPVAAVVVPDKPKRPPVKLVKNPDTGKQVTPYENSSDYGYITIEEQEVGLRSISWIGKKRRVALLKGDVVSLQEWVNDNVIGGKLPGQIVVEEYVRGDVPAELMREYIGDTNDGRRTREDAERPFIKRAGKDGRPLTLGGKEIFRFTMYDPTGELVDKKVKHDNGEDIADDTRIRREKEKEAAKLLLEQENEQRRLLSESEAKAATEKVPAEAALPVNEGTDKPNKK